MAPRIWIGLGLIWGIVVLAVLYPRLVPSPLQVPLSQAGTSLPPLPLAPMK
jgi:hypothetical protein